MAKLSFAGVVGLEGGFEGPEGPEGPESGVERPERGVDRMVEKRELEVIGGGFVASFEPGVQLRPLKSSMTDERSVQARPYYGRGASVSGRSRRTTAKRCVSVHLLKLPQGENESST